MSDKWSAPRNIRSQSPSGAIERTPLSWLKGEIDQTLSRAQNALERYAENPAAGNAPDALQDCLAHLHEITGTLRVIEVQGGILLSEEMEQLVTALLAGRAESSAAEALMRVLLQLPDYLERLQDGARDIPIALLPLVNELRDARHEALLTEDLAFFPDLAVVPAFRPVSTPTTEETPAVARRARALFQSGLVGWSRDPNDREALQRLMQSMEQLYAIAGHPDSMRLWWIGAGLVEAVQDRGLEIAPARTLFGKLERQIKRYLDKGEDGTRTNPPLSLMRQLLYYLARSRACGPLVSALRAAFRLDEALPNPTEIAAIRDSLRGANRTVMATVAAALHEDLTSVMDSLDLFVRRRDQKVAGLEPLIEQIHQIAGTIAVIDQETAYKELLAISDLLSRLVKENDPATSSVAIEDTLLNLAGRLVHVESILADLGDITQPQGSEGTSPSFAMDERHLRQAVFQQAITSLERAKEAIVAFTEEPTTRVLSAAHEALSEISGGLAILDLARPRDLASACAHALYTLPLSVPATQGADTAMRMAHLAEAISALEFYLEEQIEDRTGESFLAQGEAALAALSSLAVVSGTTTASLAPSPTLPSLEPPVDVEVEAVEEGDIRDEKVNELWFAELEQEARVALPAWSQALLGNGAVSVETIEEPAEPTPPSPPSGPTATTQEEEIDHEMVEVFAEETAEEMATIDRHLPRLQTALFPPESMPDSAMDTIGKEGGESLRTLRRSFHTLKGSGRMVGAKRLSELAWAVENLLNHAIDGTLTLSPFLLHVVEDARLALPALVEDFRVGKVTAQGAEEIAEQAWRLAHAGPVPARLLMPEAPTLETPPPEVPMPEALALDAFTSSALLVIDEEPVAPLAIDPVLFKLFETETQKHLAVVETALFACRTADDRTTRHCVVASNLLRALHTLHGSARMAQFDRIATVGQALEYYVMAHAAAAMPLNEQSLQLIEAGVARVREGLFALSSPASAPSLDIDPWIAQMEDATRAIAVVSAGNAEAAAGARETDGIIQMFLEEALEALKSGEQLVSEWRAQPTAGTVLQPLRSLLKTLANGAEIVGIPAIATLCRTVRELLERATADPSACDEYTVQGCSDAIEHLWVMLENVRAYQPVVLPEEFCTTLTNLLQTTPPPAPSPTPAMIVTEITAPQPLPERAETERGDLMIMFLAEAEDLLGNIDNLLHQLFVTPNSHPLMGELRRALHTLKGGARMVGIQAIADLSHALESMIDSVVDGHLPTTQRLFDLIQSTGDHLSEMVDRVRVGAPVESATDLHRHIENFVTQQLLTGSAGKIPPVTQRPPPVSPPSEGEADPTSVSTAPETGEPTDRRSSPRVVQEQVRVAAELLNQLVNYAAEVSITRSRVDQQMAGQRHSLYEMAQTVARLRDQWRKLEIETEVQILHRHEQLDVTEFDPLELERYSNLQQLSRGLMESVSDLASLHSILTATTRDAEMLLLQQSRITKELQEGLMRTRMVPFAGLAQRLRRIVRQTAQELHIQAELQLVGADIELDRTVLDRMVAPLEHMLRNAISHGLEPPEERRAAGKPEMGTITIGLRREGQEVVIVAGDDGRGLDLAAIRRKAEERGLLARSAHLADKEVMQFILEPGFSTASHVTQISGRGVGMDVVHNEVRLLGGTLHIDSVVHQGTTFTVRLPLTLAVNKSLLVNVQGDLFAIPLVSILAVLQLSHEEANRLYEEARPMLTRGGMDYQFVHAATLLDAPAPPHRLSPGEKLPVLLFGVGDILTALAVDGLFGARDIVVKSVGPQLGRVREISGATILGDGRVAVILDMGALIRKSVALHEPRAQRNTHTTTRVNEESALAVLVVDDSITVRKVTARLLERHHMAVFTARDGVDAVALLQKHVPDIILMDIEMPRMDGYELTTYVRSDPRLRHIPIIMITSRTGAKHRKRAAEVGVTTYLGKPYQETELLEAIHQLRIRRLPPAGVTLPSPTLH